MVSFNQAQENHYVNRGLSNLEPNDITKLKLEGNIILGDFIFNTIDEFGVVWVVTNIDGWWQHPEADMPEIDRGYGDGAYDVQGRYRARGLTIEGTFLVPHPSLVEAARDRLIAATNLVYKGTWLKTGTNPIRASFVWSSGSVSMETVNARGRTNFSIGLRAPDPIKYSWNDTEPDGYNVIEVPCKNTSVPDTGLGVVTNIGNYGVPCYLEITGPLVGPASVYNKTTDQLILLTRGLKGSISRSVVNKQLSFNNTSLKDIATLTTREEHNFSVGDVVYVSGVDELFDGEHVIVSVPTDTTFTYEARAAIQKNVSYKSLAGGVATIETTEDHGYTVGQNITIAGVDSVFDGTYAVTAVPATNQIQYSKTRVPPRTVTARTLVSNIATLTTSDVHNFIVGEQVTITGIDVNFNGTYIITAIPNSTQFSYAATRTNARSIVNKSMSNDIMTITTSSAHGFIANEGVNISNVDLSFNGGYTILDTPSNTTFRYFRTRATVKDVSIKALSTNVATITTSTPHGFLVGEKVTVSDVDGTFDGTYTITSLPSNTTFTYAKTSGNIVSTVSSGTVRAKSRVIRSRQLIGNVVTITTTNTHGAILGEQVTISGLGASFDGTYVIDSIPSANTFTYAKTGTNVAAADAPANSFAELSGTVSSTPVVPDGLATVAGSLPTASANGTATVSDTITRLPSSGKAIKKNDVFFTPGITGATAVLSADILEIDTKNREVFFNGEIGDARGRVDVLADFIELAPGPNEIEFEDSGAPESTATLKIFYRSGWLG